MKWTCLGVPKPCLLGAPFSEGSPTDLKILLVDAALVRNPVLIQRQTVQVLGLRDVGHLAWRTLRVVE